MIITVNELFEECKKQINLGNGDKKIYISIDEEGNGFHPLFYSFTNISSFTNIHLFIFIQN